MPPGWEDNPKWGLDASAWDEMKGPADTTKASGKRRKKQAHDSEHPSYGTLAIQEKVTREYLT
jgi:hypothetical protein